jgi:hypothetical protein
VAHELRTQIDIDAPPPLVWSILIDLAAYPDWNPFITSATGRVAVGERLTNRIEPGNAKAVTFKPTITAVEEHRIRRRSWRRP